MSTVDTLRARLAFARIDDGMRALAREMRPMIAASSTSTRSGVF